MLTVHKRIKESHKSGLISQLLKSLSTITFQVSPALSVSDNSPAITPAVNTDW